MAFTRLVLLPVLATAAFVALACASSPGGGDGSGGSTSTGGGASSDSGGSPSTGGSASGGFAPYRPCDAALGEESNPACDASEVCVNNTCSEICPTDFGDAALYDCRNPATGESSSDCGIGLGYCQLFCEGVTNVYYACPTDMFCEESRCRWP